MTRFYDRHVLPQVVDLICGMPSFQKARAELLPQASGNILEIGIGTGRNLPFYKPAQVQCLCGIDPGLHPRAKKRAAQAGLMLTAMAVTAERIPADDNSFDCAVCTFSLCSIPDPAAALLEMRRVLTPEGKLLFAEHGRAADDSVRRWQDRLTPVWSAIGGGCHLNRDIPSLLVAAGFSITQLKAGYVAGPRFLSYFYSGIATAR